MGKTKLPQFPEASNYELRITGKQKFFVRGSTRGLVFGSRNQELMSGGDDHLTVGVNAQGDFVQIHRTVDDRKVWWHTAESIQAEFKRFLRSHSEEIDESELRQPNAYVISLTRVSIVFSIMNTLTTIGISLFTRLVSVYNVSRLNDKEITVVAGVDKSKAASLMRGLLPPVVLPARLLRLLPKHVLYRMARNVLSLFLIRPKNLRRLKEDTGILLTRDRSGLLTMNRDDGLSFISFSALAELYNNVEKNLQLGKLSELGNFGEEITFDVLINDKRVNKGGY